MNKPYNRIAVLIMLYLLLWHPYSFSQRVGNEDLKMAAEMKESMVNKLLKQWYPRCIDSIYGGFISTFTYDFKPVGNQDKMIVTQARHVWSNAKAAEMFPAVTYFKNGARHGFEFLQNVMWDKKYGGFYTYMDRQGNVKPGGFAEKEGYGNSFAIYALAAYYRLSGDTNVLNLAKKEFKWMEDHSHDPLFKGYFQHMERDGTPIKRGINEPSNSALGFKDQNTSIHLLESFTELYNVWPDSLLKERLQEMLILIRDKMVTDKGYLTLFFKPDWTPVTFHDSSQEAILRNRHLDHVSFGHDVETVFLMLEASHALGIENDAATMKIAKKMVDHALDNGWDEKTGGFYDEGYYFTGKPTLTITANTKNWWAQAEGLNTLLMMAEYFPADSHQYYKKFKMLWNYVQTYLIDHENGDWYAAGLDTDPKQKTASKGHIWKGTYHNLRALINCIQRLNPSTVPPAIPLHVKLSQDKKAAVLRWDKIQHKYFVGYNIYKDGVKIGYTPLTYFMIPGGANNPAASFTLRAIDLYGNESVFSAPAKN